MKINSSTIAALCDIYMEITLAANPDITPEQFGTVEEYVKNTAANYLSAWEVAMGENWQIIEDEEAVEEVEPDYFEKAVADIERLRAALAPKSIPEDDLVINKLKANLHGEKPSAPPPAVHDCLLRAFAALADYEN